MTTKQKEAIKRARKKHGPPKTIIVPEFIFRRVRAFKRYERMMKKRGAV